LTDDLLHLQTKTNKKALLWQGNRTYDVIAKFDTYRNDEIYSGIARFSLQ